MIVRRVALVFVCLLMCWSAARAQDPPPAANPAPTVTLVIEGRQVRFTARENVREMRLQLFDQSGQAVYDSGVIGAPEVNWPLQTGEGATLKSGLYAYALSIKEVGEETARMRRGHFILDRATDRDGKTDRLWVTGQSESGIGAELTIAKSEQETIAGAVISNARTVGNDRSGINKDGRDTRDPGGRAIEQETPNEADASKQAFAPASPAQTIGRIARFTTATTLGDSVITQLNNNIGIGTTNPSTRLHVHGAGFVEATIKSDNERAILSLASQLGPTAHTWSLESGYRGVPGLFGIHNRTVNRAAIEADGNLNVTFPFGNVGVGTTDPQTRLHVQGTGFVETTIKSDNERAILSLANQLGPNAYTWTLESGYRGIPAIFAIHNRTVNKSALEIDGNLRVYVKELQITGGADFAENFDVRAATAAAIQPGMVVAIDPRHPGKLNLSRRAYDRRVAGIISGAGDVQPGMRMGQAGTAADGQHPVALSGRVYVWADATRGAIQPGDLLTTSATPGHAMRAANPSKAQGAILGKAMTGLRRGKGLVLVLVTLQ